MTGPVEAPDRLSRVTEHDNAAEASDGPADAAAPDNAATSAGLPALLGAIAAYVGARLVLVVAIAGAIMGIGALVGQTVPLIVAAAFGVLIALPLGMLVFKSLRINVNNHITAYDDERARRRAELQGRLRKPGS